MPEVTRAFVEEMRGTTTLLLEFKEPTTLKTLSYPEGKSFPCVWRHYADTGSISVEVLLSLHDQITHILVQKGALVYRKAP